MKKKNMLLALAAMLFVGMLGTTVQADTPLYRLYNKGLKVHLYTKDTNEYAVLGTRGWSQEGVAWNTEDQQGEPVYRLYNRGLKVHLYTKDANEYAVLETRGWSQEGVAFRSFGETPVYRLYNRGLKKHLYTKDANEYAVLATRGWSQEGVAFMALSAKKSDSAPKVPESSGSDSAPKVPEGSGSDSTPKVPESSGKELTGYRVQVVNISADQSLIFKGTQGPAGSHLISGQRIRGGEVVQLPAPEGYHIKEAVLKKTTSDNFGLHAGEIIVVDSAVNKNGQLSFDILDAHHKETNYEGIYLWEVTWIKE
ncbi:hypothetical protein J2T50_001239 [Streptococcus gallinaceus]|uniref:hypothetical protein n=1 Tax=Streptococcus gallinaceus TaxID=165758 RepID=UPI0020A0E645|nr:hypothetical protein [Streptococcus gallinaceus]MCP1639539.1 hypothetical protein [Streptococcus gallinaceus]MCP1770322.1 hypothetical protein [Streptococcus gallinaceus]